MIFFRAKIFVLLKLVSPNIPNPLICVVAMLKNVRRLIFVGKCGHVSEPVSGPIPNSGVMSNQMSSCLLAPDGLLFYFR